MCLKEFITTSYGNEIYLDKKEVTARNDLK